MTGRRTKMTRRRAKMTGMRARMTGRGACMTGRGARTKTMIKRQGGVGSGILSVDRQGLGGWGQDYGNALASAATSARAVPKLAAAYVCLQAQNPGTYSPLPNDDDQNDKNQNKDNKIPTDK